jgi:hypothetical protein
MVVNLLDAMREQSRPVKPAQLGVMGEAHLRQRFEAAGCQMESFQYKRVAGCTDGIPWLIEMGFGWCSDASRRRLVTGVNWSPGILNPFRVLGRFGASLDTILSQQRADADEPVILVTAHGVPARRISGLRQVGRGGRLTMDGKAIIGAVQGVTAKWTKQCKAEERHASAELNRRYVMTKRRAITIKEAAFAEMERAYLKARAGGRLPAKARQIMYAARGSIRELTVKPLNDQYFTQTLLPDYMAKHASKTSTWRVVFDARGHLTEPHTKRSVPLDTIEVGNYLSSLNEPQWLDPAATMPAIKTSGPSGRYGALLFVEKEGFDELFTEAQLGERYDIAIMSTMGVSVTAAPRLVDNICARFEWHQSVSINASYPLLHPT